MDGVTRQRGPGETWLILTNVPHEAIAGPHGAVVAEVYSPIREDWAEFPDRPAQQPVWPSVDRDQQGTAARA